MSCHLPRPWFRRDLYPLIHVVCKCSVTSWKEVRVMRLGNRMTFLDIQKRIFAYIVKMLQGLERDRRESLEWRWRKDPMTVTPGGIREKLREVIDCLCKTGTLSLAITIANYIRS